MQAQMGRGIRMTFVVIQGMLMGFEVSHRIQGQNVMRMIKLMRKDFPIKCPAQGVCHHAEEQHEHDEMDTVPGHDSVHGIRKTGKGILYP
jgi:hypothetical protein